MILKRVGECSGNEITLTDENCERFVGRFIQEKNSGHIMAIFHDGHTNGYKLVNLGTNRVYTSFMPSNVFILLPLNSAYTLTFTY